MQNLKKLRLERKLSQQKLADKFGITQQAIFNYENGITEPDIYMLKQFADFFHTSIDYIVGYVDTPLTHSDESLFINVEEPSRELHHLAIYRKLSFDMQMHLDAIMEELVPKDTDE